MTKNFRLVGAALIAVVIGLIYAAMCYSPITGTVVDAHSGKPIEGAVVLVEWTRTKGIGFSATYSHKFAETLTDKEGKFRLPGAYNPLVKSPDLAIYKKGYVTWSNKYIFPAREKRSDFLWQSGSIYELENFKDSYSYVDHQMFTTSAVNSTIATENKRLFFKMYDEGTREEVIKEQTVRDMKKMREMR